MAMFSPITGRKDQIRAHAAQVIGRPIVGDYKYGMGVGAKIRRSLPSKFPMMLHLKSILLKDYFGKELNIVAPFSKDFIRSTNSVGLGKFRGAHWPDMEPVAFIEEEGFKMVK